MGDFLPYDLTDLANPWVKAFLAPIGVARIQKSLTDLVLQGFLDPMMESWNICVIERDISCAQAALEDFQELLENLFALEGKDRKAPAINFQVPQGNN